MNNIYFTSKLSDGLRQCFPYDQIFDLVEAELNERISPYLKRTKCFLFEKQYIDKQWRDLYSIHYCYTYNQVSESHSSIRIHLLEQEANSIRDINPDDYLGFITLRPIPAPLNVISRAILKPKKDCLGVADQENLYMMLCDLEINIGSKQMNIETFQAYTQDSMVTICAHMGMYMIAEFMHRQYAMNKPDLKLFISRIPPYSGRYVPSKGLNIFQMAVCLIENGYNLGLRLFTSGDQDEMFDTIDSYVESCIPCVLAFGEHVITVIGHSSKNDTGKSGYIIVDDSGYHLKNTFGLDRFLIYKVDLETFKRALTTYLLGAGNALYCMAIEHDKLFLSNVDIKAILSELINCLNLSSFKSRYLIVDSKQLKRFLSEENNLPIFDEISLSHYLWYVEFYDNIRGLAENLIGALVVDASAHKYDRYYSILSQTLLPVGQPLSLLKEVR